MKKDLFKAGVVLLAAFAAIVMFNKGVAEGKDLMTVLSAFVGMFAWGAASMWFREEKDQKSGIDKAVKDELEEQKKH